MATVRTRILILSDTHGSKLGGARGRALTCSKESGFQKPLPPADLVLHCGHLTDKGRVDGYESTLVMLKKIDAPIKLVIPGAHDTSLDKGYVMSHSDGKPSQWNLGIVPTKHQANELIEILSNSWCNPNGRARKEGVYLLNEGTHERDLPNGARVRIHCSPYTPASCDLGFAYEEKEDRFNHRLQSLMFAQNIASTPVPDFLSTGAPIDILMTHGPPFGRLDGDGFGNHAGCPHLLRAVMRARPLIHCFGHIHGCWDAERVRWSAKAESIANSCRTIKEWKEFDWTTGVDATAPIEIDREFAKRRHGAFVDLSLAGSMPFRSDQGRPIACAASGPLLRGRETLMVNATIMDKN